MHALVQRVHGLKAAGLLAFWLACALPVLAAEPPPPAKPVAIATNYVVVTNVVILTNYVVTTNVLIRTNAVAGSGGTVLGPPKPSLPDLGWVPPEDGFDWIQLKSGEWLKGRLKAMQERSLEFDSEELNLLTFDWDDIRQLRSSRSIEMLFEFHGTMSGSVKITPDEVVVDGAEPRTFRRSELLSITPSGSRELHYWSGKLSLGLTVRAGNTKSLEYNAQASLQRRTPETRLRLDYIGDVSSVDSVESANNHRVNAEFNYWLSRRLYLLIPSAEYYIDPFQNIDHRTTLGAGVGYDLVDRPGLEWSISGGPAYQHTTFNSVQTGVAATSGQGALTLGTKFEWDITKRIDLTFEYRGQYTSQEAGETLHHSVTTLSIELTKRFDLDVSLIWDRAQNPKAASNGSVPKQDDFRLVLGVGARF